MNMIGGLTRENLVIAVSIDDRYPSRKWAVIINK